MPARSEPYNAPTIITFGSEQTAWREAAGLTKRQLAEELGFDESYVGQIENFKNLPSEPYAEALDTFFKTNGVFGRLRKRILDTRHTSTLPPGFAEYLEHEARATSFKNFSPTLTNGVLQHEDYAREILSTYNPPDLLDQRVAERMKRKEVLEHAQVYFTMDETVLHRTVGNSQIMRRQLEFLLEISERPNVSIDIIPQSVGYYPGIGGEFYALGLEDGSSIAYTESSGEGLLIQDPVRVARHVLRYDSLRGHALPVSQSRELIRRVIERLEA
ncbi:helix-turn-helix domain-containing protein [Actinomadura terrae]|uniref:helix-turn-helix domain-containing protein n=1 Tax=Actinomadura terrae TaxID=604353 RepID=UPI001FA7F341|nr:helix-turn-helix transcriptional regulator [Actinomadura terrae]